MALVVSLVLSGITKHYYDKKVAKLAIENFPEEFPGQDVKVVESKIRETLTPQNLFYTINKVNKVDYLQDQNEFFVYT